jgi:hypothetical protein
MGKSRSIKKLNKTYVATFGGYEIHSVDSFGVRDIAENDEEFTNFAIHGDFPDLIPEREIWIEERLLDAEGVFYIANALMQLKARERGEPEDSAYTSGLNLERILSRRLVGVTYRAGRPHKRVPERIYVKRELTLPDRKGPVDVWAIDGNLVRSFYKTDYTEGGHGYVYPWVPKGQIWIEKDLDEPEIPFIVSHEYLELRLMRDEGMEYDPAHEICSEVEFELRDGGRTKSFLAPRSRPLAKGDLAKLTSEEFFEFVVKNFKKR